MTNTFKIYSLYNVCAPPPSCLHVLVSTMKGCSPLQAMLYSL